jgi:hypothetical protein
VSRQKRSPPRLNYFDVKRLEQLARLAHIDFPIGERAVHVHHQQFDCATHLSHFVKKFVLPAKRGMTSTSLANFLLDKLEFT